MKHPRLAFMFFICGILSACATSYQAKGITGGFTDSKINDTTWRVRFDGNGKTSRDTVWNYWIYRCAQLTVEQGFDSMLITKYVPQQGGMSQLNMAFPPRFAHEEANTDPAKAGFARAAAFGGHSAGLTKAFYAGSGFDAAQMRNVKSAGSYSYYSIPSYRTITTWHADGIVYMFNDGSAPIQARFWYKPAVILEMLKPYVESGGQATPPQPEEILNRALYKFSDGLRS
ncbi:CC0125/CC1285 family lipoprotein [Noviherbaspirillum galbum]|uniref:Lipoprotein n=1 Tax=Noviherbaspirillum galbum TaxID=2709383 RepID=A0A6B3SKF1_9BURK|nr:hypothetical protein [Noviherbaspirillum galbum]NEX61263.1 hypothetical protein [Noviherbaspirillum galbum]